MGMIGSGWTHGVVAGLAHWLQLKKHRSGTRALKPDLATSMPALVRRPIFNRSLLVKPAAMISCRFFIAVSISFHCALETFSPNTLKYTACLQLSVRPDNHLFSRNLRDRPRQTLRLPHRKFKPQTISRNGFLLAFRAIALLPVTPGCLPEVALKGTDEAWGMFVSNGVADFLYAHGAVHQQVGCPLEPLLGQPVA